MRSAIVVLAASMATFFADQGVTAKVAPAGWKERFKQINQGPGGANRVCLIPGDLSGRDGKLKRGRQTSTNPRTLLEWDRIITMSVWQVDNSNRQDEGLQIAAVEELLERCIQALQRAFDPETGQLVGAANVRYSDIRWTVDNTDCAFGREVLVPLELTVPFRDVTYGIATPEAGLITKTWAKAPDVTEAAMVDYLAQSEWHFHAITGRDFNDGRTPATALQTVAEYVRRCGSRRHLTPAQSVDLYLHAAVAASDRQSLAVEVDYADAHFGIHGELVQVIAGTLTAFSATSGNAPATITAAGLGAAHVKKLVHFLATDSWAETVADMGSGVLRITDPQSYGPGAYNSISAVTVGQTEAFVIYDCLASNFGELEFEKAWPGGTSEVWPSPIQIEHIRQDSLIAFAGTGNFYQRTFVNQCLLGDVKLKPGASCYFRSCSFTIGASTSDFSDSIQTTTWFSGCLFTGGVANFAAPTFGLHRQDSNTLACAFVISSVNINLEGSLRVFTTSTGPFSGVHLLQGVWVSTHNTDVISGLSAGTHVMVLGRGAQFTYQPGFTFSAVGSGGRQIAAGGIAAPTSLMPSLMTAVAGAVPALAPCTTWAEVQAAPFNGTAWDYTSLCGFTPDTI